MYRAIWRGCYARGYGPVVRDKLITTLSLSWTGAVTYTRKVACVTCHSGGAELSNPQCVSNCLLLPAFAFIRYLHFHIANIQISFLHGYPLNNLSTWCLKPQWSALPLHFSADPIFDAVNEFWRYRLKERFI